LYAFLLSACMLHIPTIYLVLLKVLFLVIFVRIRIMKILILKTFSVSSYFVAPRSTNKKQPTRGDPPAWGRVQEWALVAWKVCMVLHRASDLTDSLDVNKAQNFVWNICELCCDDYKVTTSLIQQRGEGSIPNFQSLSADCLLEKLTNQQYELRL
jgi:hypothetical protein